MARTLFCSAQRPALTRNLCTAWPIASFEAISRHIREESLLNLDPGAVSSELMRLEVRSVDLPVLHPVICLKIPMSKEG
jgi:hypothetical protein